MEFTWETDGSLSASSSAASRPRPAAGPGTAATAWWAATWTRDGTALPRSTGGLRGNGVWRSQVTVCLFWGSAATSIGTDTTVILHSICTCLQNKQKKLLTHSKSLPSSGKRLPIVFYRRARWPPSSPPPRPDPRSGSPCLQSDPWARDWPAHQNRRVRAEAQRLCPRCRHTSCL